VPPPIVMVHGAFCGGWVFDRFRVPFEAVGHRVLTPDLPGHEAGARGGAVTGFSMSDYARAIAAVCGELGEPPVLVGHSLGGLVAQLAAMRTPVAGLMLLAPSAPWGVSGGSLEEAVSAVSLYALGPFWTLAIDPDYPSARRYTFDRAPKEERREIFSRMVPESGRALWETLNWWLDPFASTLVSAQAIKAPVLAIVGERDAIHPPSTVRQTAARIGGTTVVMPGMSHWLPGEPGWEAVAGAALGWLADLPVLSAA
jgi:pimeloyl-ACP methyl ester carboxylesterase